MGGGEQNHQELDEGGHQHRRLQEEFGSTKYALTLGWRWNLSNFCLGNAAIEKAKLFSKTAPKGKT